jgi:hypothetical protein
MLTEIDPELLDGVTGGRFGTTVRNGIEWARNTFNAGAVALNTMLNPTTPVKPIPEPKRIERVLPAPSRPGQGPDK